MPLDLLLDFPQREHLRVATKRRKASYDIKAKNVEFHVGD